VPTEMYLDFGDMVMDSAISAHTCTNTIMFPRGIFVDDDGHCRQYF